jgi:hypothetical protein
MSHALSPALMMLTAAMVDRHLREARLEHRSRFVPSGDETGTDRIDIVEVEAVSRRASTSGGVSGSAWCGITSMLTARSR